MARRTPRPVLTAEQSADADRLHAALLDAAAPDLQLIAATTDATLFGATEFAVRDLVLGIVAQAVWAAFADRAKKVAAGAVALARPAMGRPSS